MNTKVKLFISYSHDDDSHLSLFIKHLYPFKENNLIDEWYDRMISPGKNDFMKDIGDKIDNAEIIFLLISASYLASLACAKEMNRALLLHDKYGVDVIPIILSPCAWLDDTDLSNRLALPKDGLPITKHSDQNEGWLYVYEKIKIMILKIKAIKDLKIKDDFIVFLEDVEMLKKAHSQKECVLLDDIFIYPELERYSDTKEYEEVLKSEKIVDNFFSYRKIAIAGNEQSGKTALCKILYKRLFEKGFIPVYMQGNKIGASGKIEHKIDNLLRDQYDCIELDEIKNEYSKVVPIIDDFHLAKNKDDIISELDKYSRCIIITDDIFNINIKDEKLISAFVRFKIRELKPSQRNLLIKKWLLLTDKDIQTNNTYYQDIDQLTYAIDTTLGKNIGRGIMPSYPFFILSMMLTYDALAVPLDQEITSQGYCYQAFIYFYLNKQGVRNDEINIYINFLTESAFYFYQEKATEVTRDRFCLFIDTYSDKYNLPIKRDVLLNNLSQIISVDSFGNYYFRYQYIYYFFVAKYLADNIDTKEVEYIIENIIRNLHVNENAYIAIFVSHHTKSDKILDEIQLNALCLFEKYLPAKLSKEEMRFFDSQVDVIVKAALPSTSDAPENSRSKILEIQDNIEDSNNAKEEVISEDNPLTIDLRRSIKTVEVMGHIIKNRAGSLERKKIEQIFEFAMNVLLKVITSFFKIIESKEDQEEIIEYISERLGAYTKETGRDYSKQQLEIISRSIFWNNNFFLTYSLTVRIISSLGSDKLLNIIDKVCSESNTPASYIVNTGIKMWFGKNIDINGIAKRMEKNDFSEIAKRVIRFMVINYCSLHSVRYDDRQKISSKLGIPVKCIIKKLA